LPSTQPLFVKNRTFQIIVATYFPAILLVWAFVVRRVLGQRA